MPARKKNVKELEMGKKDDWVSCLAPFLVICIFHCFEAFLSLCRKVIVMQMILAHRDANEVCPVEMQLVIALWMLATFAFICKFISAFQLPCCVCSLNALDLVVNTLRFSLVLMMK